MPIARRRGDAVRSLAGPEMGREAVVPAGAGAASRATPMAVLVPFAQAAQPPLTSPKP